MKIQQTAKIIITMLLCIFSQEALLGMARTDLQNGAMPTIACDQNANTSTREKIEQFCQANKPYQDIVINGETVYRGWNTDYCQARYEIIKNILHKIYPQAFTQNAFDNQCHDTPLNILDLGAAQGYFSFKLAHDFGLTCFMLEDGQSATEYGNESNSFLKDVCKLNTETNNIFLLATTVNHKILRELQRNDRFDVIMVLCMLHHLDDWQECLDILLTLGKYVIIELPDTDNGDLSGMDALGKLKLIPEYILKKGGTIAAKTSRFYKGQTSTFYVLKPLKRYETDTNTELRDNTGISLYSFMQLNGQWPVITPEHFSSIDKRCTSQEIRIKNAHVINAVGPCED